MFTFLLISWSSLCICEALRSCWCLRKRLLDVSSSCNSFTFSSLFMAANLQRTEQFQQPISKDQHHIVSHNLAIELSVSCAFTLPSAVLVFPLLVPGCFCAVPPPFVAAPVFKPITYLDSVYLVSMQSLCFIYRYTV